MQSTNEPSQPRGTEDGTAYHSLLKDFQDERRLMSVLSFMRKERLSIIRREITDMRERLHDRAPR